jgi:glucokinase
VELTIGVDVGGTKIAAGVVDVAGRIVEKIRISTPAATAESVEGGIVAAVKALMVGHEVAAVGVAAPGFVDAQRTTLRFTPNLPMADRPLRSIVQPRVGVPVVVENDANAAAWGEYRFGGGRGVADVVLLTVGTGLGGGIVLDGRLLRGAFGIAGEFGHVRIVPGGLACGCGNRGCWEQYTSGRALIRQARALARSHPQRAHRLVEMAGGDVAAIDGGMITEAARDGDPAALDLLAELGSWLGEGIADIANVLDPAVVVIGGGVSEAGDLLLEPARKAFAACLSAGVHRPHLAIRAAELGNDAGLIGAADLARVR